MNNNTQLKITAISVSDLVKLLKQAGSRHVSEAAIQKDIDAGAPVNSDGTINLINYTAYLLKEEVHNANN
jgi:DNA integrity scanning protein DisA with diadenylate cyclase activity